MKYVVHLKPAEKFCEKLNKYREIINEHIIKMPSLEIHCTLMTIHANPENEKQILKKLGNVALQPFYSSARKLDMFDSDCLVIRLSKNSKFADLHNSVITSLSEFINWKETPELDSEYKKNPDKAKVYRLYGSPHYAQFYNPHITIAKIDPSVFGGRELKKYFFMGDEFLIDNFALSKKENNKWNIVKRFSFG